MTGTKEDKLASLGLVGRHQIRKIGVMTTSSGCMISLEIIALRSHDRWLLGNEKDHNLIHKDAGDRFLSGL